MFPPSGKSNPSCLPRTAAARLPGTNPQARTPLVGRTDLVRAATAALDVGPLITLTGAGGIGKTRLAMEILAVAGGRFADGAFLVPLAAVRSDDVVALVVVDALGLAAETNGPTAQLVDFVRDREILLVLDNCEHVLEGVRELVGALLADSPGTRVLVTSREPLQVAAEKVIGVRPLSLPPSSPGSSLDDVRRSEAVQLLVQRASAATDSFRLDESTADDVAAVCRRLDGLPLAIELAASRLRSMTARELVGWLDDRFAVLTRGDPTALPHHRTLRAAVQWSWDLCNAVERRIWARMSVFVGGAEFDAVDAVCDLGPDMRGVLLDSLHGLVTKSVLVAQPDRVTTRYVMTQTLADFGRTHLTPTGSEPSVDDLHARHFRDLAARARTGFASDDQAAWAGRLLRDHDNLLSALEYLLTTGPDRGDAARDALELTTALRFHWITRAPGAGREVLRRALGHYREPDEIRLAGLYMAFWAEVAVADVDGALGVAARMRRLHTAIAAPAWTPRVEGVEAVAICLTGDLDAADAAFEAVLPRLEHPLDLEYWFAAATAYIPSLLARGRSASGRSWARTLIGRCEKAGERWMRSYGWMYLLLAAWFDRDCAAASDAAARCLALKADFDDRYGTGVVLHILAGMSADLGQDRRAAVLSGAAFMVTRSVGATTRSFSPAVDARFAASDRRVRQRLGDAEYALAHGEGAAMSLDAARTVGAAVAASLCSAPSGTAVTGGGPLTSREHEVAVLVSQGLTNRMIATALVISPRTVDGHLERILFKLGFRSRAQLAAWVAATGRLPGGP